MDLFCGYTPIDEPHARRFRTALAVLSRQGVVRPWSAYSLPPGEDVRARVIERLDQAAVVALLLSPDFLDCDFCYTQQLVRAAENHLLGSQLVVPILLRPCDWLNTPLARLQAIPRLNGLPVPVTRWKDQDDAWQEVTDSIRSLVERPRPFPPANLPETSPSSTRQNFAPIPACYGRWIVVVSGDPQKYDRDAVQELVHTLRCLSEEPSLILVRIVAGSTRFVLFGTKDGYDRLEHRLAGVATVSTLPLPTGCAFIGLQWVGTPTQPEPDTRHSFPRPPIGAILSDPLDRDASVSFGPTHAEVEALFRAHSFHVLKFLTRRFGLSVDEAEPLVQDTFLKLLNHPTWVLNSPQAFLRSLAYNAGMDHLRARKRASDWRRFLPRDLPSTFDASEARLEKRELIRQAGTALTALSPPHQEILSLLFRGIDDHQLIGDMLFPDVRNPNDRRDRATVGISRARAALRRKLASMGVSVEETWR